MVIRAKAQNPQKTSACAAPATGLSLMTLPCSSTSQTNRVTRGQDRAEMKTGVGFRGADNAHYGREAQPETRERRDDQQREGDFFRRREHDEAKC